MCKEEDKEFDLYWSNKLQMASTPRYIVLESKDLNWLQNEVNEKLNDGFKLVGGLTVVPLSPQMESDYCLYIQALIR